MCIIAISNRKLHRALDVFRYAGLEDTVIANSQRQLDEAIRSNTPVATEDALLLARSEFIDVLVRCYRLCRVWNACRP